MYSKFNSYTIIHLEDSDRFKIIANLTRMTKKNVEEKVAQLETKYNKLQEDYKCLQEDYEILMKDNSLLEDKLAELNENTIISSMNDMKEKYEELVSNSVCITKYNTLKRCYVANYDLVRTFFNIHVVIKNNLQMLRNTIRKDLDTIKYYEFKVGDPISEDSTHNKAYGSMASLNKIDAKLSLIGELSMLNELQKYDENDDFYHSDMFE